jgi:hypothetical protein
MPRSRRATSRSLWYLLASRPKRSDVSDRGRRPRGEDRLVFSAARRRGPNRLAWRGSSAILMASRKVSHSLHRVVRSSGSIRASRAEISSCSNRRLRSCAAVARAQVNPQRRLLAAARWSRSSRRLRVFKRGISSSSAPVFSSSRCILDLSTSVSRS